MVDFYLEPVFQILEWVSGEESLAIDLDLPYAYLIGGTENKKECTSERLENIHCFPAVSDFNWLYGL